MTNIELAGIAAGWDEIGSVVAFTEISTPSGLVYPAARLIGNYSPGVLEMRGDKSLTVAGSEGSAIHWDILEDIEYYWDFQDNFCGGARSYSGQVTIRIPTRKIGVYGYWNAWIHLPRENDLEFVPEVGWLQNVNFPLFLEEDITP